MRGYLLRRLLIAIPTLLLISLVVYVILAMAPGDPLGQMASSPDIPPEVRANLRQQLGLDEPVYVRYVKWLASFAQGNWGYSFTSRIPALDLILQRLPTTLAVVGTAYVLAVLIALPLGITTATRQYSWYDHVATGLSFAGFSLPTFFTGVLAIVIFSVQLHWLPMVYDRQVQDPILWFKQAIMPVSVLALFQAATLTRYVRAAVLEVLGREYVLTARAKGLDEPVVVLRHVVRNALVPVVSIIALQLPAVFTGAVVTEQIFRVPGIGSLLIASINASDTPVIMAIVMVFALLVIVFTLVADVLYGVLDPHVRFS